MKTSFSSGRRSGRLQVKAERSERDTITLGQTRVARALSALLAFQRGRDAAALFAVIMNEAPLFPVTLDEQRR